MTPMPEDLRSARAAKGWSQNRLVSEIELYAQHHAVRVATTASLKVYVSEWENGRRSVSAPYTGILRVLFGNSDAQLFGKPGPERPAIEGHAELGGGLDAALRVGPSAVKTFLGQTEAFRTLDGQRRRRSRRLTPWPDQAEVERAARHCAESAASLPQPRTGDTANKETSERKPSMTPDTQSTIAVRCRKSGHWWTRLRIEYPQWKIDGADRPAYDVPMARQLLALTGELPTSKRGLVAVLAEYRLALYALAFAAERADRQTGPGR
jgi:transcriptional regulator with XRE-family HTH domain